jgi:hypothetical protein
VVVDDHGLDEFAGPAIGKLQQYIAELDAN